MAAPPGSREWVRTWGKYLLDEGVRDRTISCKSQRRSNRCVCPLLAGRTIPFINHLWFRWPLVFWFPSFNVGFHSRMWPTTLSCIPVHIWWKVWTKYSNATKHIRHLPQGSLIIFFLFPESLSPTPLASHLPAFLSSDPTLLLLRMYLLLYHYTGLSWYLQDAAITSAGSAVSFVFRSESNTSANWGNATVAHQVSAQKSSVNAPLFCDWLTSCVEPNTVWEKHFYSRIVRNMLPAEFCYGMVIYEWSVKWLVHSDSWFRGVMMQEGQSPSPDALSTLAQNHEHWRKNWNYNCLSERQ